MRKLKVKFNAPVTLTFVIICFAVTLLGELLYWHHLLDLEKEKFH
jgi:hypothetical protein